MIWELEFNWEKSPVNTLLLALGNYQILRENEFMNRISSPRKEHLRCAGQASDFVQVSTFLFGMLLGLFGRHPDGDLVWILSSDKPPTLFPWWLVPLLWL